MSFLCWLEIHRFLYDRTKPIRVCDRCGLTQLRIDHTVKEYIWVTIETTGEKDNAEQRN
jgi:hypothetical protein